MTHKQICGFTRSCVKVTLISFFVSFFFLVFFSKAIALLCQKSVVVKAT